MLEKNAIPMLCLSVYRTTESTEEIPVIGRSCAGDGNEDDDGGGGDDDGGGGDPFPFSRPPICIEAAGGGECCTCEDRSNILLASAVLE